MKTRDPSSPLFFSMSYEFLQVYLPTQCGRSPHTVESYRDALSLFRRYVHDSLGVSIAKFSFAECTRECVLGFMDYLAGLNSKPSSRNQRLAALKSYLGFAADKDVALQPIELALRRVPQCKVPKTEKMVIPAEAMEAILREPPNTKGGLRDRTILTLLYDSATRLAELLGLKLSDVALEGDNPYIRVTGKGSKQRIIPITKKTAAHLSQYVCVYHTKQRPQTNLLFYTLIKGVAAAMSEGNVERFVREYGRRAQSVCPSVPDRVHPHMFRRSRATQLYQDGVDLPLVSSLLGHAHLETTRLYAKPSLKMLRQAMESVETPTQKAAKPIWEGDEAMMAKLSGLR